MEINKLFLFAYTITLFYISGALARKAGGAPLSALEPDTTSTDSPTLPGF